MKIKISTPNSMYDKDIISYQKSYQNLIVNIGERWSNAKNSNKNEDIILMNFIFTDVKGIKDVPSSGVSGFAEETDADDFVDRIIKYNYEKIPEKLPYKKYVFYDIDDNPCMEIIAKDVKIEKV